MIEFIKHEKSGKWYVIEINGRPWLMIDFFRRVGFNFLKSFLKKHLMTMFGNHKKTN